MGKGWLATLSFALLSWAARPTVSHAQSNPFEAFVRTMTAPARYRGPTAPFPSPVERPSPQGWVLRSERFPLSAHADAGTSLARVTRALRALEFAYEWADAHGWPLPFPDAGAGGSADFDLYLTTKHGAPLASARVEAPLDWTALDASTTYALVDAGVPNAALEPCAVAALVHAGLLAHDPAEAANDGALRATAAFASFQATGELGCDDARVESQRAPFMGAVGSHDEQVTSLAMLLAMLSARHDKGTGAFVRGVWELARQHSASPGALHRTPNFWQALSAALERAGESLDQAVEEFALARYTAPAHATPLPALPRTAEVPVRDAPAFALLPKHLPEHEPGLGTYGSAYTRVNVSDAPRGARLDVWLTGDPTTRWSLVGVRLGADGKELGRVAAPARRVPQSYLPVELTPDTREVLLAVIALPFGLPDETAAEDSAEGSFRLVLGAHTP